MSQQIKTPAYAVGPRHTSTAQALGSVKTKVRIPAGTQFGVAPFVGIIYGPALRAGSKVTRISLNVSPATPGVILNVGLARVYHRGLAYDEPGATALTETLWPGGPSTTSAPDNPTAFGLSTALQDFDASIAPFDVATPQAVALFPTAAATLASDVDLEFIVEYLPPENLQTVTNFYVLRGFGSSDQTT